MEQASKKEFITIRIKLAEDKLEVARDLFKNGHYREVVSSCYYAMFYAVKALLLAKGQKEVRTHEGLKTIFGRYCKEHGIDLALAKLFAVAQEARQRVDYKELAKVSRVEARKMLKNTELFLKAIKRQIF